MTDANISTPADNGAPLSRLDVVLGLLFVILVHLWNLFFLFCVMPGIADTLQSLGGATNGAFMARPLIGLGHFTRTYAMMGVLLFLVGAVWNGWAINQPNLKLRKKASRSLLLLLFISFALFPMAIISLIGSALAMGGEDREVTVTETFTFPSGEILMNQSRTNDIISANHLYYQSSPLASYHSLGEIDQEESPISLRESKPLILRDGNRMAIVVDDHVFEPWARDGVPRWAEITIQPDAVVKNFLSTFLKPGDPSFDNLFPLDVEGYFNKSVVNYVFDHLDLAQNVLVTRLKTRHTTFPKYLVYSSRQYGMTLTFDLERTLAANNLSQKDYTPSGNAVGQNIPPNTGPAP